MYFKRYEFSTLMMYILHSYYYMVAIADAHSGRENKKRKKKKEKKSMHVIRATYS